MINKYCFRRFVCICILVLGIFHSRGQQTIVWKATWISPGYKDSFNLSCPVFKKVFTISKKIKSAIIYITAHGLYEASIDNKRIGDAYFTPGWTNYDKRLQYQQYDVKDLLKKGSNEINVTIGDGWYRGAFGGQMQVNNYGSDASLLLQLEITYADGNTEFIISDKSWDIATGPIIYSNIYNGEWYDARIEISSWTKAIEKDFAKDNLVATISEPVTKQERFKPVRIDKDQVIDFGQNMAGWVQIKVKGNAGDTIRVNHAEVLDKEGKFYTGNLREAKATDIYILKGDGEKIFEPHFTYHGFRYVKVEGFKPTKDNCTAIALYSKLEHTGTFSCSSPLINQLQHNIEWSLNSNFFDIPTDCPQRSERLGWTGDAQVFCRTASFNRNVKNFFAKWLADLRSEQGSNGGLPVIVPSLGKNNTGGVAGWGDVATIVPWTVFEVYGDTSLLKEQYSSMKAWVDYILSMSKDYLWKANGYGDWYAPDVPTDLPYIDQCFFVYSTQLLINAATVLNYKDDILKYKTLLQKVKDAFLNEYEVIPDTQTAYVLALQFEMLPDSLRKKAVENLVGLIKANKDHLSTGFLGTPYLLHVLSKYGYTDVAYAVLNQDTYPSWLYPIKMGATTIWEKWDGIKPDGTVQATSYNHYAYGAVGDWLYRVVTGIDLLEPGYKKIKIQPNIGGGLTWAKASYKCPYGKIVSEWNLESGTIKMHVEIPKGTTAIIVVPGKEPVQVGPGQYEFKTALL